MPSYSENQALYLAASGIGIGSMVTVTKRASSREGGWDNSWVEEMDDHIGDTGGVEDISSHNGIYLWGCWYPYFVLKPVNFSSWKAVCHHYPFLAGLDLTEKEKEKILMAASRYASLSSTEFQQIVSSIICEF